MKVSDDRLRQIAEEPLDSVQTHMAGTLISELAYAILERHQERPESAIATRQYKRSKPEPLNERRQTICKLCHADLAIFRSRRTGKDYFCDIEMDYIDGVRMAVTGSNWLHKCEK